MDRRRLTLPAVLLGLAFLTAGCAEPPTGPGGCAAKQALAALAGEAATYAPTAYSTAEQSVAELDAELATQEASFALLRDYERATELIGAVETATGQVRDAIAAERQRLSNEANGLVADANQAITDTRASIAELDEDDLEEGQAEAWESDLADVSGSLEEVGRPARRRSTGRRAPGGRSCRRCRECRHGARDRIRGPSSRRSGRLRPSAPPAGR